MAEIIAKLDDFVLNRASQTTSGTIQKVGVIGGGAMGQEIAKTISQHGFEIIIIDLDDDRVQEAMSGIARKLDEEISHWGMTNGEKRLILSRIKAGTDYQMLADCDIVIEAINSRKQGTSLDIRKDIFCKIENVVHRDTIITSNTAILMISDLASGLKFPDRAVGLHFISPTDKIKVLEVVKSSRTSDEVYKTILRFVKMLEKKPIQLAESPGNLTTRMTVVLINEACNMLMEGVACIKDIDETMKSNLGFMFGPFELADRIGLDKLMKWMDGLYNEFGDQIYKTSPVIKRLVRNNFLGKATGEGFYRYDSTGKIVGQTVSCPEFR